MCVVREENEFVGTDFEVESAVHSAVRCHGLANALGVSSCNLCQCNGSDAVVDVDAYGYAQIDVCDIPERRYEVVANPSATDADVFGMEVAFVPAVVVAPYPFLQPFLYT